MGVNGNGGEGGSWWGQNRKDEGSVIDKHFDVCIGGLV